MADISIKHFYGGRSVFVTGVTGFMGKVLVQKLLRSCPEIDKIYLLIRTKRDQDASPRLQELITYSQVIFQSLALEIIIYFLQLYETFHCLLRRLNGYNKINLMPWKSWFQSAVTCHYRILAFHLPTCESWLTMSLSSSIWQLESSSMTISGRPWIVTWKDRNEWPSSVDS